MHSFPGKKPRLGQHHCFVPGAVLLSHLDGSIPVLSIFRQKLLIVFTVVANKS